MDYQPAFNTGWQDFMLTPCTLIPSESYAVHFVGTSNKINPCPSFEVHGLRPLTSATFLFGQFSHLALLSLYPSAGCAQGSRPYLMCSKVKGRLIVHH